MKTYRENPGSFFRVDTMAPENITAKPIVSNSHDTSEYTVHVSSHWNTRAAEFSKRVEGTGSTLFQSEFWLSTWYATVYQRS